MKLELTIAAALLLGSALQAHAQVRVSTAELTLTTTPDADFDTVVTAGYRVTGFRFDSTVVGSLATPPLPADPCAPASWRGCAEHDLRTGMDADALADG